MVKTGSMIDNMEIAGLDNGREKRQDSQPKQAKTPSQKELIETGLKLYDHGFNIVPVGSDKRPLSTTWNNKQRISREELEKKLSVATGIALVAGDLNPFDYRLVILDIDNPRTALSKSPKLKDLATYSVSWRTGLRCPRCGDKHLDMLGNNKYKCQKCGYSFDLSEVKERGLGVLFLIDRSIADKYGLNRTKRLGDIEFLVENYQLIPPSLHPHGIRYEWINPLKLDSPTAGIIVLSEEDLKELLRELEVVKEEKPERQAKETLRKTQLRELMNTEILKAVEVLRNIYVQGFRQMIWLYLSGWGAKAGISPVSIAQILVTLYSELQDEDSIKTRGSAIVYSYKKAGIDLEPYWEKLKEVLGEEPYGSPNEANGEEIRGFSGLQEIAENIFKQKGLSEEEAEQKALELLETLSKILKTSSPYRDTIFFLMDYDRQIYAVANLHKLVCARARKTKDGIRYMEKVINGAPTKITVYYSPIKGEPPKYSMVWESKILHKPLVIDPPIEHGNIHEYLKRYGLIIRERLAEDLIASIIAGAIEKGFAEIKYEIGKPGFFYIDGKLIAVKVDTEMPSPEELRKALELFLLIAKYYENIIDKFSFTIRWGLTAPFSYAYKQMGKMLRGLYAYGQSGAGKTTQGKIFLSMWGLGETLESDLYVMGATSIDTPARLGEKISKTTFPIVVNEPADIFQRPDMSEMIKNVIEGLIARTRIEHGIPKDIPALSNIYFTSNMYLPRDDAILRRFYVIEYTPRDMIRPEKAQEFEKEIVPRIKTLELAPIGRYIANRVLAGGLNTEDPIKYVTDIFIDAFSYAGLKAPDWLSLGYSDFIVTLTNLVTDTVEDLRSFFLTRINEEFNRFIGKVTVETLDGRFLEKDRRDIELENKAKVVLENNLIPWMYLLESGKTGRAVVITSGILKEINGKITNIASLKAIAEFLKWEYTFVKIAGKSTRAVVAPWEDFLKFLNPSIDLE
ncbi:MAG: bifunctional DNA primase/polymerase [Thermofilum sp.]|jgi:hypothetical protein|uniref:bifunctional DNA primase/polymerase n=1 Tax=Thermofilum sp. TaxID=1961369 RepID=UPI0025827B1D|nr:bifunctional DNA primase/polymerase [Thermofilum sp.]MCI4408085.1 bifunctional DNA primase/polymerase [Thermofilum sp.]